MFTIETQEEPLLIEYDKLKNPEVPAGFQEIVLLLKPCHTSPPFGAVTVIGNWIVNTALLWSCFAVSE